MQPSLTAEHYLQMGHTHQSQGQLALALQFYDQALTEAGPHAPPALLANIYEQRGLLLQSQHKEEAALICYQDAFPYFRATQSLGDIARLCHNIGNIYLQLEQFELALEFYQEALHFKKEGGSSPHSLALTYHQMGLVCRYQQSQEQALAYLQQSLALSTDPAVMAANYLEIGYLALVAEMWGASQESLEKAREIYTAQADNDNLARVYEHLGYLHQKINHPLQAIEHYQQALGAYTAQAALNDVGRICYQLGQLYYRQQQYEMALAFFQEVINLPPSIAAGLELATAYHQMGLIYQHLQQPEQAISFFHQSWQLSPHLSRLQIVNGYQLGKCYAQQGHLNDAITAYQQTLTQIPEQSLLWAYVHYDLGFVYQQQQQTSLALPHYEQALQGFNAYEQMASVGKICHNIGNIYWAQQKSELALAFYQEALGVKQLQSDDASVSSTCYQIALVYQHQGAWLQAQDFFRQALAGLPPESHLAALCLHRLAVLAQQAQQTTVAYEYWLQLHGHPEVVNQPHKSNGIHQHLIQLLKQYPEPMLLQKQIQDGLRVTHLPVVRRAQLHHQAGLLEKRRGKEEAALPHYLQAQKCQRQINVRILPSGFWLEMADSLVKLAHPLPPQRRRHLLYRASRILEKSAKNTKFMASNAIYVCLATQFSPSSWQSVYFHLKLLLAWHGHGENTVTPREFYRQWQSLSTLERGRCWQNWLPGVRDWPCAYLCWWRPHGVGLLLVEPQGQLKSHWWSWNMNQHRTLTTLLQLHRYLQQPDIQAEQRLEWHALLTAIPSLSVLLRSWPEVQPGIRLSIHFLRQLLQKELSRLLEAVFQHLPPQIRILASDPGLQKLPWSQFIQDFIKVRSSAVDKQK